MNKTLALITAVTAFIAAQASLPAAGFDDAKYKAGEVQIDAIAVADSDNLKDYDAAGGIGITYWHWQTVGVGAELKTFNTDHAAFDNIGLNLAARYPLKLGVTPFTKIGFDWNAEQVGPRSELADFEVYIGVGVEKRFNFDFAKNVSIGFELRGVRAAELAPKEHLQGLFRLGKTF